MKATDYHMKFRIDVVSRLGQLNKLMATRTFLNLTKLVKASLSQV
jgi:hypothetical protein